MEAAKRAQASAHGRRLFISGVSASAKKTDLQQEFGEFGHVTDIEIPLTAKGVAFVEFDDARDAADAAEGVSGRKLKGMVLKVKMADVQKQITGAAAAIAQGTMTGMTRVEDDYRQFARGGSKGGTPPFEAERKQLSESVRSVRSIASTLAVRGDQRSKDRHSGDNRRRSSSYRRNSPTYVGRKHSPSHRRSPSLSRRRSRSCSRKRRLSSPSRRRSSPSYTDRRRNNRNRRPSRSEGRVQENVSE